MKRTVWITPPKGRVSKTARPAFMELEGHARGDVEGQAVTGGGCDVSSDSKHRDAAMLHLNVTEAVEALLVGILKQV